MENRGFEFARSSVLDMDDRRDDVDEDDEDHLDSSRQRAVQHPRGARDEDRRQQSSEFRVYSSQLKANRLR